MPGDIDPTALSRPAISTTPILPPKPISSTAPTLTKSSSKISGHVPQRIDLEPLYTALKLAIGEHWGTYKESISLFVMGQYIYQA
jgi:transcriptional coactivator HFI1/ADA1